jgi:putative transposase
MLRDVPLTTGEIYHVYNRGAHKQPVFTCAADYRRFQIYLHLANHSAPIIVRDILIQEKYREPFSGFPADKSLVDICAYSLMPSHFHLVLKQKTDGGITRFMKKVCGGYSTYFNLAHKHSGTLFQGNFKSSHIDSDPYFLWIFAYVHLNAPSSNGKKARKDEEDRSQADLEDVLRKHAYSSYIDYYLAERPERSILAYNEYVQYLDRVRDVQDLANMYSKDRVLYGENLESI